MVLVVLREVQRFLRKMEKLVAVIQAELFESIDNYVGPMHVYYDGPS